MQCNETGHPALNMMESQRKLRQERDQNFPTERKPSHNKHLCQKKERNPKQQEKQSLKQSESTCNLSLHQ